MTMTLQVLYSAEGGSTFDHDYYLATHMPLVQQHMGPHIDKVLIAKGLAGGPDTPPGMHVVATMMFKDQAALDAALGAAGPVLEDLPKFYSGAPQMLIGEVIAE